METEKLDFYSFFTKYSLMEEYGFSAGLISRLFRKVLPAVPDENTVEYLLLHQKGGVSRILSLLDWDTISGSHVDRQLTLGIQALCAKVAAFGLDSDIKAKCDYLALDAQPFERLVGKFGGLQELGQADCLKLLETLDTIDALILDLRKNKNKIGTNLHLTLTTRRILEYTQRVKELLHLKANIASEAHWEDLLRRHLAYLKQKDSLRRYVRRHSDLLALEVVEHTANKGEKYIAENHSEYWGFFRQSLLGGGIIALFALFKIILSSYERTDWGDALYFSLNYALCFIVVKQLGGIIATKQPAMTASTIAKNIDQQDGEGTDSANRIVMLVRKVFSSQFISVIGNFSMALGLACALMYALRFLGADGILETISPKYLIKNVVPSGSLFFFAAIAGCFLALSGLISGYVDNKMVEAKIAHRLRNSRLFPKSKGVVDFIVKKTGAWVGNVSLGFFLGCTFLLSHLLPFAVDIRHIAFSSANIGYAVMNGNFDTATILLAILGALGIGFVNFIVSFSITLFLALKSRTGGFGFTPRLIFSVVKDFLKNPLRYFLPSRPSS